MGLKKCIPLLLLPIMVSECFWNPFSSMRWGRNNANCGYYMQSYMPSQCNYQQMFRPNYPLYQTMDSFEGYPYYGQQQTFKPFMIGQSNYGRGSAGGRSPSYFPYYYGQYNQGYTNGQYQTGQSSGWQPSTFTPSGQIPTASSKTNTQQYKIQSY